MKNQTIKNHVWKHEYKIPENGILYFDDFPQENYLWSGYCNSITEYRSYNFSDCTIDGIPCYMCFTEMGIVLLEYLVRYVLDRPLLRKIETLIINEMDYWFFKYWECGEADYDSFEIWHELIDLFINHGIIRRVNLQIDDDVSEIFILLDTENCENYTQEVDEIALKILLVL